LEAALSLSRSFCVSGDRLAVHPLDFFGGEAQANEIIAAQINPVVRLDRDISAPSTMRLSRSCR
jgi:hypothetical protein